MAIPNQTITITDPGLGLTFPAKNIPLFMGASSSGTNNTVVSFSNIADVGTTLGEGPLVEYVTRQMQVSGGPVLAMRLATTTAGVSGAVTASGGGPVVTVPGAPFDTYTAIVTVVLGGILGTGTFTYTLNNAVTTSPVLTIPAGGTFLIPNTNITLTFAAGTYVATETYSWTSTEPLNLVADVQAGFTALELLNVTYDYITLCTTYPNVAASVAMFAAVSTTMASLVNVFEYKGLMMDAGPDSASVTAAAYDVAGAAADDARILVAFSTVTAPSGKPIVGRATRISSLVLDTSVEAGRQLISTDLALVPSGRLGGAVAPVTAITFDSTTDASMDTAKFTTTRTWKGRAGEFYLTNANLRSPAGSDFLYWQHRRIIDDASEVVQVQQQLFINRGFRTIGTGNTLDPLDAERLQKVVKTALQVVLSTPSNVEGTQGHVTAFVYEIDLTNDVLTTQTIISTLRIKPFGYAKFLTTTIGYAANLVTEAPEEEA